MKFKNYEDFLEYIISYTESFVYTVAFIIIAVSMIKGTIIYIIFQIKNPSVIYDKTRLQLSESFSMALSFIVGIEILKLFYIKEYKQLIIVISLVLIKIILVYFVEIELQIAKQNINLKK